MSPFEAVSTAHQSAPRTIAQKAGEFLTLSFGPQHRNKLIAQALNCSPDMAKGLRRGDYWTVGWLEKARDICGPSFGEYVFSIGVTAPAPVERCWWATSTAIIPAPAGHEEFMRRRLKIPATLTGDYALVAMRNHGWLALSERDGLIEVKHNARMMNAGAGRLACEWLRKQEHIETVRRVVEVDRDWLHATHRSAAAAVEAIEGAALIARKPAEPWKVETLTDAGSLPSDCRALLHAHEASPATSVRELAENAGIMDRVAILRVDREVTPLWVGSALHRVPRKTMGEPIENMADSGFAATMRRQMIEITREGRPAVHRLTGTLNGKHVDYIRPALPERIGADAWHVLTFPHILEAA